MFRASEVDYGSVKLVSGGGPIQVPFTICRAALDKRPEGRRARDNVVFLR